MTWLDCIRLAFETLGGSCHLSELYDRIEDMRSDLEAEWKATVRATLEAHSSDSTIWRGRYNFFQSLGKGQGRWALREQPQDILVLGEKYSRQDLLKVFHEESLGREGIFYCKHFETTLLFTNLNNRGQFTFNNFFEGDYFHWDTQNNQSIDTPRIAEIVNGRRQVLLFCRLDGSSTGRAKDFVYCGELEFFQHEPGSRRPAHIVFESLDYRDGSENENLTELWDWAPGQVGTGLRMNQPSRRRQRSLKKPNETERLGLIVSRVGQGYYREKILKRWKRRCAVTECSIKKVLIASHIVPWSKSNDDERLDVGNGILLSPNLDALFDRHLISFSDKGEILISSRLAKKDLLSLGIKKKMSLKKVYRDMKPYLERHRSVFQEKENS